MMSPLICKYRAAVKKNAQNGDLAEKRLVGPLTLKFDRVTQPFLKIDRRHWIILKSKGTFQN